jgi:hypothetical protein
LGVCDPVPVHLVGEDELVCTNAHRAGDASSILEHVVRVVADVQGEIERLVGPLAHAADAFSDNRVNAEAGEGTRVVDA